MNKDLQFPIVYDLRIIYSGEPQNGLDNISQLLTDLCIDFRPGIIKEGGKPTLSRLGFNISLSSKQQMDSLYNNLQTIPEVKWAT
ncbi:MAG: DUF493 domain-containing protein [Spirochaetaceae bacterium]